jgi:hypothetical protein
MTVAPRADERGSAADDGSGEWRPRRVTRRCVAIIGA